VPARENFLFAFSVAWDFAVNFAFDFALNPAFYSAEPSIFEDEHRDA
jgi:hypothetical protein